MRGDPLTVILGEDSLSAKKRGGGETIMSRSLGAYGHRSDERVRAERDFNLGRAGNDWRVW